MSDKLNEILAVEWACVRLLRRAEARPDEPGQREVLKRIRKDCSVNCVSLANAVRQLGGSPTDVPSPRFSLKLAQESLGDILDLMQSAQQHVVDEIATLIDEPELEVARSSLALVQRIHQEDMRWLKSVSGNP